MNVIGQTDNFQSHSYNNLGISVEHPPDWKFASLKNGIQLVKEKNGVYMEIRKSNSQPSNTTLEQLALNSIQERFTSRKDFQLLNLSKTSISGNLPAYKAVYEFLKTQNENSPTSEGATNRVLRITTFANGVAYIIKYVSEKNKYDSYLPIADKIIDSLKFNVQENVKAKSDSNNNNNNNKPTKQQIDDCNRILDKLGENNAFVIADVENGIAVFGNGTQMGCDDLKQFWKDELAFRQFVKESDAKGKEEQNTGGTGNITVGYGDLGGYSGKGKIVIKNKDTGQTLVTRDINFGKLRASEGNDCCYKVYTFDKSLAHYGDTISALVTGGGGSWDSGPYKYEKNLRIGMDLDEIGEADKINYDSNYNPDNHKKGDDVVCDSDKDTKAPSCDEFEKEFLGDDNNENNKEQEPDFGPPDEDFEVEGNLSG